MKPKKKRPLNPVAELSARVARQAATILSLAETATRQAEAIRILADRMNALEDIREQANDELPTHYLNGAPIITR